MRTLLFTKTSPVLVDLDGCLVTLYVGGGSGGSGPVTVEHGPTIDGPWVESGAASNALMNVFAGESKATEIDVPVRGLRVTFDGDGECWAIRRNPK